MRKADAVSYFGSQRDLAKAIGITDGSVSAWGEVVPLESALLIEHKSRRKLRVDHSLYPRLAKQMRGG